MGGDLDLSQAALVSGSTGHDSAGLSGVLDMSAFLSEAEDKRGGDVKLNDASCINYLDPCMSNFRLVDSDLEIFPSAKPSDRPCSFEIQHL